MAAAKDLWTKHRTFVAPMAERTVAADGRLVVPSARVAADAGVGELARLGLVLDVLHKRRIDEPGGPYGWRGGLPSAPYADDARTYHELDVPMDLTWLRAHAVLPDDIDVVDVPHVRLLGPTLRIESGRNGAGLSAHFVESPLRPDEAWAEVGWREGEPWDGTRPVVRSHTDRLLGRPGVRIPPFSSNPDWRATGPDGAVR